jgi:hypothetical protein
MHWNLPEVLDGPFEPPEGDEPFDEDLDPPCSDPFCESCGEEEADPDVDDLCDVPAYAAAHDFALSIEQRLTARLRDAATTDEDAVAAARAALDVSAKIINGHGLGYDRDSLCGNIACCKRALGSLRESLDGLLALRQRGVLLPAEADELLRSGRELGEAVSERIEDLRRRVWWR